MSVSTDRQHRRHYRKANRKAGCVRWSGFSMAFASALPGSAVLVAELNAGRSLFLYIECANSKPAA
jgi:hypothetical protein